MSAQNETLKFEEHFVHTNCSQGSTNLASARTSGLHINTPYRFIARVADTYFINMPSAVVMTERSAPRSTNGGAVSKISSLWSIEEGRLREHSKMDP